jgi:ferrochelatase
VDTAVLLMAYGDVRGGRPASPEAVAELAARYARVGGRTPLLPITRQLAERVQERLEAAAPGRYRTYVGMRHWHPYIRAAVRDLVADGARRLVGLVLAPHYARMSVGAYRQALDAALAETNADLSVTFVERWHDDPGWQQLIADRVRAALAGFPAEAAGRVRLVFSAHSLPERILTWGDPYPAELRSSAAAVAARVGSDDWELCYQSAGHTGEPWLGPDIVDVIARLAREGRRFVLSIPFGFVCDHLEVLYDIDVEAQEAARRHGVMLRRIAMPNADPAFAAVLADIVRRAG